VYTERIHMEYLPTSTLAHDGRVGFRFDPCADEVPQVATSLATMMVTPGPYIETAPIYAGGTIFDIKGDSRLRLRADTHDPAGARFSSIGHLAVHITTLGYRDTVAGDSTVGFLVITAYVVFIDPLIHVAPAGLLSPAHCYAGLRATALPDVPEPDPENAHSEVPSDSLPRASLVSASAPPRA
jgi:hypothetical protein